MVRAHAGPRRHSSEKVGVFLSLNVETRYFASVLFKTRGIASLHDLYRVYCFHAWANFGNPERFAKEKRREVSRLYNLLNSLSLSLIILTKIPT